MRVLAFPSRMTVFHCRKKKEMGDGNRGREERDGKGKACAEIRMEKRRRGVHFGLAVVSNPIPKFDLILDTRDPD